MSNDDRSTRWTKGALTLAATAAGLAVWILSGQPGQSRVSAQAPTPAPAPAGGPKFEVATIKINTSNSGMIGMGAPPGSDRFTASNVTLRLLVRLSYQLQDFQIVGGPDWITSERYDIVGKAEAPPTPVPPGQVGAFQLMMRGLLAERFKLVMHAETRELPVYSLVMARADKKLGPQLAPATVDCAGIAAARGRGGAPPPIPQPGERPPCGMRIGPGSFSGGGMSMAQLAQTLSMQVGRVVLDRTGLTGNFDIDLTFTPAQMPQGPVGGGPAPGGFQLPPIDPNGPSIFTALQEQLGLKLDSARGPVDVMVIDSVDHPTED